jgi:NADPH2:quinone reductase
MESDMKAWQVTELGAPDEVLALREKEQPAIGPGQMRIAVATAAMGLPDAMMCRGKYEFKPELPFTPGQEICGTIIEVGEGVSGSVGQRVMGVTGFFLGHGGLAEECLSMEGMVYPVPDGMSDEGAAAFGIPYQTAWIGLVTRGGLKEGDTLVVLGGAGGSGSAAVQLGHTLGARVIAVAGGAEKAQQCRVFGADETIDHQQQDFVAEVNRLTEGRGADLVFDPVGGEMLRRSVDCLANAGRLLAVGFACGEWGDASTHALVLKNASVLGVFAGAYNPRKRLEIHAELTRLYEQRLIAPLVHDVVGFDAVPQALSDLESRRVNGKLVTRPG